MLRLAYCSSVVLALLLFADARPGWSASDATADAWVPSEKRAPAPKLVLRSADGQKRQIVDLKGKVVVVNFWATWCGPCRLEMPAFTKVYAEYKDRGVEFIGAANETRAAKAKVAEFVSKLGIEFPIWFEASLDHMEAFKVGPELPATVFVDAQGRLAARVQGVTDEAQLRSLIDRLLNETAPGSPGDGAATTPQGR